MIIDGDGLEDSSLLINNQIKNQAQYGQIKKNIARLYTTIKNEK